MFNYMDNIISFIILMVIFFISGLQLYCRKRECSEIKKYNIYTVILAIYVVNVYYIVTQYSHYNSTTLKMAGLFIIVPIILYMVVCQQNCYQLFLPTFFIIFPCILIIFNFYVWSFQ
jgi:hypothetical protein